MKALKDVPLNWLALRAEMPKARFLDVIVTEAPSNSIFCISSSTVFRVLRQRGRATITKEEEEQGGRR